MQGGLTLDPATVERFRVDLGRFCDPGSSRILVAVSGGADSLALLLLARAVLGDRCAAATVDHGVRPEAVLEARFVSRLCADRGIAHTVLTEPDPRAEKRPGNQSAALRLLRYSLLKVELRDARMDWLATAHHADDQLETVLMRLNRGAGVSGLAGIRDRQERTIRPLLTWRRHELEAVVASVGLTPVADPSNVDDRYDRARLRKALVGADWLDAVRVSRSAKALADAEEALAWTAQALAGRHCSFAEAGQALLRPEPLPFELRRRYVERCLLTLTPAATLRGGEIATLVEQLDAGRAATLAEVRCTAERDAKGKVWRFSKAPPRRD